MEIKWNDVQYKVWSVECDLIFQTEILLHWSLVYLLTFRRLMLSHRRMSLWSPVEWRDAANTKIFVKERADTFKIVFQISFPMTVQDAISSLIVDAL